MNQAVAPQLRGRPTVNFQPAQRFSPELLTFELSNSNNTLIDLRMTSTNSVENVLAPGSLENVAPSEIMAASSKGAASMIRNVGR